MCTESNPQEPRPLQLDINFKKRLGPSVDDTTRSLSINISTLQRVCTGSVRVRWN